MRVLRHLADSLDRRLLRVGLERAAAILERMHDPACRACREPLSHAATDEDLIPLRARKDLRAVLEPL